MTEGWGGVYNKQIFDAFAVHALVSEAAKPPDAAAVM